ncbi:MAG: FAD-dependent monooxygenase [Deltaproteobacteria bacterium]|nr:FAD-dependent monooxygenase [Deltaproteobacteria bacterium]
MRVIIVGAGIGGLTAALTLLRSGLEVQVFEQAAELREVGAGIQISPNATRLLHRLGLTDPLRQVAVRPQALQMRRWEDGKVLSRQPLADVCEATFGAPYYHLYRPDLLAVLASAVPDGIVQLSHRCVGVQQSESGVAVTCEDGMTVSADVVVGADGIHSAVRALLFGPESPHFSGSIAYRGLVPAERLEHLQMERNSSAWLGPDRHFVHYYVGAGRFVNFVGVVPGKDWHVESWSAKGEVADALAEFATWHPQVQQIIGAVDFTNRWGLYDRDPLDRWSVGRVTLLGDAAHAMLPFMAQGAVQSIEDAVVLAKCLEGADHTSVPTALRRYEEMRKPRASQVQAYARRNGTVFHLPDGEAQRQRDAQLAAAGGSNPLLASSWLYGHDVEAELSADWHGTT